MYVGAGPGETDTGRPLAHGDTVLVDDKEPHNAAMFARGDLIDVPEQPSRRALLEQAAVLDITGRTKLSDDELVEAIAAATKAKQDENGGDAA